jgi:hypothetical protein
MGVSETQVLRAQSRAVTDDVRLNLWKSQKIDGMDMESYRDFRGISRFYPFENRRVSVINQHPDREMRFGSEKYISAPITITFTLGSRLTPFQCPMTHFRVLRVLSKSHD